MRLSLRWQAIALCFEGFDHGEVGVVEVGVFADEGDGDLFRLEETFL